MNTSWLKYLGFLGFIGLFSLVTGNLGLIGFFGFFSFFGFGKYFSDERLEANINRATKNCFISSLIVFAVSNVIFSFIPKLLIFAYAFAANFIVLLLVFIVSLKLYDNLESN